jgi:DNA topoisomerase I
MNLVIVESPAKCKKIAEFLGPTFRVLATMGHIRALEEDLDAVGIGRDFEPRFRFLKEKAKATAPILEAARKATTIYLAADDDREGEAIAYSVACLLKKDPLSFPRSVFHEITAKAVKEAIANPRKIDMNRVYAQQARSVLDMMVGFTISPLLWKHVARKLSAGRCQTPALRLIADREKQIKSHTTQTSWALTGIFKSSFSFQAKMCDELEDEESSMNYLENVNATNTATITSTATKQWTASPPKPLITSSLQQEASALYKINPKNTMKIAQTLYEAGHITYMRTDMAVLSLEAVKEAQDLVVSKYGPRFIPLTQTPASTAKAKAKPKEKDLPQAQEAHEAIRPTHFDLEDLPEAFSAVEKKIYSLIWKRAVQSTMSAANGEDLTVKLLVNPDTDFPWQATWKRTLFEGWQILGKATDIDKESEEEDTESSWTHAAKLTPQSKVTWLTLSAAPKRSKASPRFNEATLIRELEKKGIGRPSTFASLVETLFDKGYMEKQDIPGSTAKSITLTAKPASWPPESKETEVKLGAEKQKLVPTPLGISVLDFCVKEFPQLFAYEFTAQMENRLDAVSKGEEQWKAICRDTWASYSEAHDRLKSTASVPSKSEKVNDFGGGFKAVMSAKGPLLVQEGKAKADKTSFYTIPVDTDIASLTKETALELMKTMESDGKLGEYEGKPIMKRKGPFGEYLAAGELKVPFVEGDTLEVIIQKFNDKKKSAESVMRVGQYIFKVGQYGPYMYKESLKKKVFVSVPATINPKSLTEAEANALYAAKKPSTYKKNGDKS